MKNFKLNKQTIFTLLGLLVIVGSIPIAVLLVKQRQEIRKEAAVNMDCGHWCASKGTGYTAPYCKCNNSTPDSGYTLIDCEKTTDCNTCCAFKKSTSGPTPTTPSGQNCGSYCASQVGHTDFPWCICNADRSPQAGYVEYSRTTTTDCTKSCVAYTSSSGDYQQAWGHPVWGRWNTGRSCAAPPPTPTTPKAPTPTPTTPVTRPTPTPTIPTGTPTPTGTGTPTPTPTVTTTPTPTPTGTGTPTPTPTIPVSCDQTCSSDGNCTSGLICYNSRCRNSNCPSETDCTCPGPTPTPTATSTPGPTTTPTPTTVLAQVTPTPVVELPQAGFALPTFGAIIGGILLIITSLIFIL